MRFWPGFFGFSLAHFDGGLVLFLSSTVLRDFLGILRSIRSFNLLYYLYICCLLIVCLWFLGFFLSYKLICMSRKL